MVRCWRTMSIEGRETVHDKGRSGWPMTSRQADVIDAFEISRSSLHSIIIVNELQLRKVCARWVPRLLTDDHKQRRMEAAEHFLQLVEHEGDALHSRIVTGNENCPDSVRQTVQLPENLRWDVFGNPAYSLDLAPSEYHLFPELKKHLGDRRFPNDEYLRN
ncbi:hypothetical protein J437_LFUL011306 [Ladona fulva]|uniref:Uncharacterized protein n=1 Tax=Ladona fulva TaxID=123851 RepID=A0A8K0KCJ3_LADFU|nr:hypothetical protein J437_LFUL011306 [Ladona fulva]